MARRKKPENETLEQTSVRKALEKIADAATRNEKVSWDRKMDNMVKLIARLRPIEDKIVELMAEKQPIFDEISTLRIDMVKECIHPAEHLAFIPSESGSEYVECKFCMKRFTVRNDANGSA
jgi:hypothetical protein